MTSHSHSHSNSYGNHAYMFDQQQANYYSSMPAGHSMQTPKRDPADLSPTPFRQHHHDDPLPGNLSLTQLRQYHQESEESSKYVSCANTPSPSDSYQGGMPSEEPSCSSDSSNSQQHLDFMHGSNSLGLMGNMNPPSPNSIKSSFGLTHEALSRPTMLQRQISSSNLSDTSSSSYFNDGASIGSHSQIDPTSPIRSSFTPAQSPLGLSHSISSLSGLAIGAHQAPPPSFELSREGGQRYATFQGRNHDDLLSLSGSVHLMNAPPLHQTKRRSTCGAHTLYTTQVQQLRDERANEDRTPMPPSTHTFMSHHSPNGLTHMSQQHHQHHHQHHSDVPLTPSRSTNGNMDTDLYRNGMALSFSAPRLRRMDSYDSVHSGGVEASPMSEFGHPLHNPYAFHGRSLEDAFVEQEAKVAAQNYHLQQQQEQQGHANGLPKHPSLGHLSSSAMSRVSSAPIPSPMTMGTINYGMPGTPIRTTNFLQHMQQTQQHQQQHQRFPSFPHTPISSASSQNSFDVTFSAPQMVSSRSMGTMQSPFASSIMSPMSLIDHGTPGSEDTEGEMKVQSPSSGATRTMTPKSRGGIRGNIPPPLIVSSADKLHICFCGKRFKRLEHLKRHNRVHTQERPHPCPAPGCNKWFGRTDNLTQHLKTHYRTLGRSSENLLNITNAKASSMTSTNNAQPAEPRHDPHAAAAAAAAQAVSKTNAKSATRRSTVSNDGGASILGGPISLNRPESNSPTSTSHHQFNSNHHGSTQSIKLSASPI